jgi:hypothetical protein
LPATAGNRFQSFNFESITIASAADYGRGDTETAPLAAGELLIPNKH